ncbi:MAG: hypothetical protein ACHQ1G_12430 [Planctomycetota bacterium]
MSGLVVLLAAAAASAYGAWASLKSRPPLWAAALAATLFAAAGVLAVVVSWISGDGVILPGLQLSPGLRAYYVSEADWGLTPYVTRWLLLVAPLAHLLVVAARRDRPAILRPLPATAIFVGLLFAVPDDTVVVVQARGPERVAYLTIASREGGARLILATGEPFAAFLRVVHVHEAASTPPQLHLNWTNDGKGLVVRVHEKDPVFAVDLGGDVTGELPVEEREWSGPGASEEHFSLARKDVFKFIHEHRGLAPP